MNRICPRSQQICLSSCIDPCPKPEVNAHAVEMQPKEIPQHGGIIATFLGIAEKTGFDTNLEDEVKLSVQVKL